MQNNPSLSCIEVDDATYSTTNWYNIDATTSFSEDCSTMSMNNQNFNKIKTYPNPVTEYLTIKGIDHKNVVFQIIDILGEVVTSKTLLSNQIPVSHLSKGIYFLKLENSQERFETLKFIKQ